MPVSKQWVLSNQRSHSNEINEEDFDLIEDHAPDLSKGEILCRALFLSVDPITSLYMSYSMEPGDIFPGRQVARVVESKNKEFPKGKVRDRVALLLLLVIESKRRRLGPYF